MGLGGPNTSGNQVVHQNSSSEMMPLLHTPDLHVTHDTTREEDPTYPTLTSYGSFNGFSGTPNITGSTTRDRSSVTSVSGLTLPSQSMSLSNNNSNTEQEPQPPFNASLSSIGSIGSIGSSNNNNDSNSYGVINGSGNPTGVMINRRRPPRIASSPINPNNSNNEPNNLGGKKKRKTKKVNRK